MASSLQSEPAFPASRAPQGAPGRFTHICSFQMTIPWNFLYPSRLFFFPSQDKVDNLEGGVYLELI